MFNGRYGGVSPESDLWEWDWREVHAFESGAPTIEISSASVGRDSYKMQNTKGNNRK